MNQSIKRKEEGKIRREMFINEVIQRGSILYIIKKTVDESREVYLNRVNYIIDKFNNNPEVSFDDIVTKSYIWRNINYSNMTYTSFVRKDI